jgi:hypothetical protein
MICTRVLLWLALAGTVLAVAGAAGPGTADKAAPLPADVAAVPADGVALASFRVADLWNAEAVKPTRLKLAKEAAKLASQLENAWGARPEQIERLTFLALVVQGDTAVTLVRLTGPADRTKVAALAGKGAKEEKYKGHTVIVGTGRDAVALLDERTYVVGRLDPSTACSTARRRPRTGRWRRRGG